MKTTFAIFALAAALAQTIAVSANVGVQQKLLRGSSVNRALGYNYTYSDDGANAGDDAYGDDGANAGDDAYGDDATTFQDVASTTGKYISQSASNTQTYVANHAQNGYANMPAEWDTEEWIFISLMMFLFGGFSSILCLMCVFPRCCPATIKTGYARFIAPGIENSREENLIAPQKRKNAF